MNFVFIELCDNDYGRYLEEALHNLIYDCGGVDFCPYVAKSYIIEHVVSSHIRNSILRGYEIENNNVRVRDYLTENLRVTFRDKLPTYTPDGNEVVDHDGGSVYYDVNLDKIFRL